MAGKSTGPLVPHEEAEAFKARFRLALGLKDGESLSPKRAQALANVAGTSDTAIRAAANPKGKTKSQSAKVNALLARELRVDPDWLALGIGEMHSERIWPFGLEVTPEDFFLLEQTDIQPALDVLKAAITRKKLGEQHSETPMSKSAAA